MMGDETCSPGSADLQREVAAAITREQMANLPIRRYEGEVQLVASRDDIGRACEDMLQESVVGFDTETRPSFRKGQVHLPCLVQVATARAVYLFQLSHRQVFESLDRLLSEPCIVKAGVAVAHDLRELKLVFPFTQRNVLDLGVVARRCGKSQTGLRNLTGIFLGFRIPKGAKTTNWSVPHLSAAQITYAATDAWACRELFLCFDRLGLLSSSGAGRFQDAAPSGSLDPSAAG